MPCLLCLETYTQTWQPPSSARKILERQCGKRSPLSIVGTARLWRRGSPLERYPHQGSAHPSGEGAAGRWRARATRHDGCPSPRLPNPRPSAAGLHPESSVDLESGPADPLTSACDDFTHASLSDPIPSHPSLPDPSKPYHTVPYRTKPYHTKPYQTISQHIVP